MSPELQREEQTDFAIFKPEARHTRYESYEKTVKIESEVELKESDTTPNKGTPT